MAFRKSELTLLALEESRWVMGDGWSREKAAGALGILAAGDILDRCAKHPHPSWQP